MTDVRAARAKGKEAELEQPADLKTVVKRELAKADANIEEKAEEDAKAEGAAEA